LVTGELTFLALAVFAFLAAAFLGLPFWTGLLAAAFFLGLLGFLAGDPEASPPARLIATFLAIFYLDYVMNQFEVFYETIKDNLNV